MRKYQIIIKKVALKELKKLPKQEIARISKLIKSLSDEPRPRGCKKLKSYDNLWRVRSGNYRVIYGIEDKILIVEVMEIGDRKDIY